MPCWNHLHLRHCMQLTRLPIGTDNVSLALANSVLIENGDEDCGRQSDVQVWRLYTTPATIPVQNLDTVEIKVHKCVTSQRPWPSSGLCVVWKFGADDEPSMSNNIHPLKTSPNFATNIKTGLRNRIGPMATCMISYKPSFMRGVQLSPTEMHDVDGLSL